MANKGIFSSVRGILPPNSDTVNEACGVAYKFAPEQALAQLAVTGCFNHVFYADAAEQLDEVIKISKNCTPEYVAKTALFSREQGYMKDMPGLLCAILSQSDIGLCESVFDRVIDNGKMIRNFVQIIRSGVTGRKSLGTAPKRLVRSWFEKRTDEEIFTSTIGNDPSIADVIKMVHPRPGSLQRAALYGYLLGKAYDEGQLPEIIRKYEDFKTGKSDIIPDVPFQFLTSLDISESVWKRIAINASWQMTRMNLNTFARHGVFKDPEITGIIANRLRNRESIIRARVFPYQLLCAYRMIGSDVPKSIGDALQDALEISIENVPVIEGKIYVCPDVSGSMQSPVTGFRKGSTSKVRCIDVASLMAAAVLRRNPDAEVIPFSDDVISVRLNPRESVMTNAEKLASLPSGGTCCSAPLRMLNRNNASGSMVIMISDNQSWIETVIEKKKRITATLSEWQQFKYRNQDANLVCIDLQPYTNTQAQERMDIMNIGGFSDQVFKIIAQFAKGELGADYWVKCINNIKI